MQTAPYTLKPFQKYVDESASAPIPLTLFQAIWPDGSERIEALVRKPLGAANELEWLWPSRIPRGQVTLIEGAAGAGKSFVAYDLLARVTAGLPWPAPRELGQVAAKPQPAAVLLVTRQDDDGTVSRRLRSLGVDSQRVCRLGKVSSCQRREKTSERRPLELPYDLAMLRQEIEEMPSVTLVVIDPLSDFCDGPQRLSQALRDLNDLAREKKVAIVVTLSANCRFDRVGSLRVTSRYRTDEARSAWCVVADPEDPNRRLFVARRTNSFVEPAGMPFRLHEERVIWNAEIPVDPHDPLGLEESTRACLTDALVAGSLPAKDVFRMGAECGFTPQQLRSTAKRMGIVTEKAPGFGEDGYWLWKMPGCGAAEGLGREEAEGRGEKGEGRGGQVEGEPEVQGQEAADVRKAKAEERGEPAGSEVELQDVASREAVVNAPHLHACGFALQDVAKREAVVAHEDVVAALVSEPVVVATVETEVTVVTAQSANGVAEADAKNVKSLEKLAENGDSANGHTGNGQPANGHPANGKLPRGRYARKQERRRRQMLRRDAELANAK